MEKMEKIMMQMHFHFQPLAFEGYIIPYILV